MLLKSTTRLMFRRNFIASRTFSSAASGGAGHHDTELYEKLVGASFIHAKHTGFNDHAISAACRDLELPSVTGALLKNGAYEIVEFAMKCWLHDMTEDLSIY
jgi:hypothetical protein